jgi:2-phosphoglycerate kinase
METAGMRVILIGGTSHVGKSTVARELAERLGWDCQSTDTLARHPGRPWQTAPGREEIVASHYESLTVDELVADVVRHYRETVWTLVEHTVTERVATDAGRGLVIEGSALLPGLASRLGFANVGATWLVANREVLRRRIVSESGYEEKSGREQALVEKFLARALRFNDFLQEDLRRLGLTAINVGGDSGDTGVQELADLCLAVALANARTQSTRPSEAKAELQQVQRDAASS